MSVFDGLVTPKILFESDSKYNGHIEVVDTGKIRRIRVDGLTQSLSWNSKSAKQMYWGKAIKLFKEHAPSIRNILVLGLGGGTLCHLLYEAFPEINITSVEIDPVMLDIAEKYFELDKIPNHKIYIEDAFAVVGHPERFGIESKSFDALFVDIYTGLDYPDLGSTGTFFAGIKNIVHTGGFVMFNRLYIAEHREDVHLFIDKVEAEFDRVLSEVAPGRANKTNMLLFGKVPA